MTSCSINIARKVVTAFVERLNVTGFTGEDQAFADWAYAAWQANRMDALEREIFKQAKRDGETFVVVSLNDDNEPQFTVTPRFVDSVNGGEGYGCRAEYPDDDVTQPMKYAVKRWTEDYDEENAEHWTDDQKRAKKRQRMTMYFPDHLEKFALAKGKWELTQDADDALDADGWIPWVDASGDPLGIPVIHFRNDELECEIDSTVVSMQNLLNKTLIDFAESADASAFAVWVALGFIPTSDGKPLASDGSNRAEIKPGAVIGTNAKPTDANLTRVPGDDPKPLMDAVDRIMLWVAQVKDLPPSRFLLGGQTPSAETQKQLDSPLLAHIAQLHTSWGDAFEDMFYCARRLANFVSKGFDESALLETVWVNPAIRSDDRDDPLSFWQAIAAAVQSVPGLDPGGLLKRYGWSDADVASVVGDGVMRDLAGEAITQ